MLLDILWTLSLVLAISCSVVVVVLTFLAGASDRSQQAKEYEMVLRKLLEKIESQEKNRGKSEKSDNS
tara:strand:- start:335 stop:538 length:204 start_codon:yes stop_codon:yes gene_type:complete